MLALFVSGCAFVVAFLQMRIASGKLKLDLYTKRFEIYQAALALYQNVFDWKVDTYRASKTVLFKGSRVAVLVR